MTVSEETIDATLNSNGELQLVHPPRLPAGPVQVTIRVASRAVPSRLLSEVVGELAAEQRSRGFGGRSAEEINADEDARQTEDAERDQELDAARRKTEGP